MEGKNTEAGDEARDEKGTAVFSFHVIKHLLWLRARPAGPGRWFELRRPIVTQNPPAPRAAHLSLAGGYARPLTQ